MSRPPDLDELPVDPSETAGVEDLADAVLAGFSRGGGPSVGLEEELILVEPGSLAPVGAIEPVLARLADRRFAAEFRTPQLELILPPALTVGALCAELAGTRRYAVGQLGGAVRLLAAGTHPVATGAATITDRGRYRRIAADHVWGTRRGLPSGLHVHVAVGDPDEALAVYNAARTRLPELAALAANSPFFEGGYAGLASTRLKLVEDMPRTGIPPLFSSWRAFAAYAHWGLRAGLFPDLGHLWWDLRPRPDLGTLEFRIADTQTGVADTAAIVAVCQALVATLGTRFRAGDSLPVHPAHAIAENRWRAVRDGVAGELVDLDTGEAEPARHRIGRLLLELEPYASELGSSDELEHAWTMLARNGELRQRLVAIERGVDGLVAWLVEQTERPRPAEPLEAQAAPAL
jgi:carboxylate-amine ligase